MNNIDTPYSLLDPSLILAAIENVGFRCNGSLFALNSYENRVYQVGLEDAEPIIAKFYRPHRWSDQTILEEHQFANELSLQDIPVIAPLVGNNQQTLHHYESYRFALFKRQGGRTLELDNMEQLKWMGRFIGRLHAVGASRPFKHRLCLDVEQYGYKPYQFLLEHDFIPLEIRPRYCILLEELLLKLTEIFKSLDSIRYIRLHGDCHVGNVLWSDAGPHIVDLDDCLMGPAIQDIWMLLTGNTELDHQHQFECILSGYEDFHDFNYRERWLIEPLRTLRMLHYSAWLAKRWNDPAFRLNFPWFNTLHYWREQLEHLEDQDNLLTKELEANCD